MTEPPPAPKGCVFADPLVARIVGFIRRIGIVVEDGEVGEPLPCPGIRLTAGGMVVDPARLRHPGDLLHEAGHLAVMPPERRVAVERDAGADPAEEMMAIAWSYAAAIHLGIEPAIVFHAAGYRGASAALLENFSEGRYLAVPMLQWLGMTYDEKRAAAAGVAAYPAMRCWLRGGAAS